MEFSIWHIFIPIVVIFETIETPIERVLHLSWAGFFSLTFMTQMAIFYFLFFS